MRFPTLPTVFTSLLTPLLWLSAPALPADPAFLDHPDYAGSKICAECHTDAYTAWRGSHHDLAMQVANTDTVLGNFSDSEFNYAGKPSRFFRKGEEFWVNTEGPDGKLSDYRIDYVFGVEPLQQYLIAFPGGRLQALGIAWDTRPAESGGQRWYHLYPDEEVAAGDPLHWTGPYQNWNLQCAECHSTHLEKNYNPQSRSYRTTWSEINVACESCHGPGATHVKLAKGGGMDRVDHAGFPVDLAERGAWAWPEGKDIAVRNEPLGNSQQVESCGRCHARRGTLGDYQHGRPLLDTHRPALLLEPLYHPDGQILDEVYVYGSFVQSKMYQAGVVCSNCHEPHSNQLRAPGNGVCAQCHKPASFDTPDHHRHPPGSSGAACVNCHMPSQNYMVIDARRDHSMRIPRPDLSVALGTPNACNQCHADRDSQWAVNSLRDWGVHFNDSSTHPARSLALARKGDGRAVPGLVQLSRDPQAATILRATAVNELASFSNREALETAVIQLNSEDPMLRWTAASTMRMLPLQHRYGVLEPLIDDDITTVRIEVARLLAEVPLDQVSEEDARRLQRLFNEYLGIMGRQADTPEGQLEMGLFFVSRRLMEPAELAYRNAIDMNPQLVAAYMNLADLYRMDGREDAGRTVLLNAIEIAPEEAAAWHALGLLETRAGQSNEALEYLGRAAELETTGIRYRYVYGVALHDGGQPEAALAQLRSLLREAPANPDLLLALATYSKNRGPHRGRKALCRQAGRVDAR